MNLLAIDTARGEGGVALLRGGDRIDALSLGAGPGYGEVLFGAIERALAAASLSLGELDGFAVATGPGSFTGIRVGIGAAKALAEVNGKPLVGVSNLRALARSVQSPQPVVALLDARRGDVFAACYGDGADPLVPETVGRWEDLAPRLNGYEGAVIANEPELFEAGGPAAGIPPSARTIGPASLARVVALLAAGDLRDGRGGVPELVEANYIRRPDARPPAYEPASRR